MLEVFRGHSSFIFQSKTKDKKKIIEIFDSKMKLLASCRHKHTWKSPAGSFRSDLQSRTTEIILEGFDGTFLGEINEIPPQLISFRLIRKFEIIDDKKKLLGRVREKPKFIGSTWVLEDSKEKKIAEIVGDRGGKDYRIKSPDGELFAKCYRDSSMDRDSYRVDVFVGWDNLFLVLSYVLVLHVAKTVWVTREGWLRF